MRNKSILLILSLSVIVLAFCFLANEISKAELEKGEVERKQKDFLQTIIDSTVNEHPVVNASLKGKVVVINIWATWCGPCMKEIPELNNLAHEFKNEKVVFLALNDMDSASETKKLHKKSVRFDYQLLYSQNELIEAIQTFALPGEQKAIPVNIVVNPDGKIEHYFIGFDPKNIEKIRAYLRKAVSVG